jgi:hypothetical protein
MPDDLSGPYGIRRTQDAGPAHSEFAGSDFLK